MARKSLSRSEVMARFAAKRLAMLEAGHNQTEAQPNPGVWHFINEPSVDIPTFPSRSGLPSYTSGP